MSTVRKVVLTYKDEMGTTRSLSWKYAKSSISESAINTLASVFLSSGSIYTYVPVSIVGAKLLTEVVVDYDVDNIPS